jgi:hypothetical protein
MKLLKNLVKTDTLNVEELMMIKGSAASVVDACDQNACKNHACSSNACTEAACNHYTCSSNSCSTSTCTKFGCVHAADNKITSTGENAYL